MWVLTRLFLFILPSHLLHNQSSYIRQRWPLTVSTYYKGWDTYIVLAVINLTSPTNLFLLSWSLYLIKTPIYLHQTATCYLTLLFTISLSLYRLQALLSASLTHTHREDVQHIDASWVCRILIDVTTTPWPQFFSSYFFQSHSGTRNECCTLKPHNNGTQPLAIKSYCSVHWVNNKT